MTLWKRSIQWQLIISMGAALGVTTLIVVLIYSSVLHQMTERYLIKQALPAQVSAIRNDLERTLAGPISATEAIAGNSLVQDWLAYGENPIRMSAFARYLDGVKQQQNALTTSIAVLESGNFYSEQGQIRVMSRDNPADSWFYTLVDGDQDQVASIDTDKTSGLPTLFINQRIALKDKTLGVAGLGYSLQSLSELIGGFQFGERGVIFLIGADQQVKVHPNASFNDSRSLSDLTSVEAANTLTAGSEPVRFQRDNEAWLASAQPLQRLGLTLVSLVPEDEIYADARAALLRTSLIAGAVGLLALALMALLVRGLVQPLRRVSQALGAISAGGGLSIPYRDGDATIDTAHYHGLWDAARKDAEAIVGHALGLEIEPGRFLVAESGVLLGQVRATKNAGSNHFVLVDTGFNELMRPSMYGSWHGMEVLRRDGQAMPLRDAVVAGPLCESGDVFTQGDGGVVLPRALAGASVGDLLVIHDTGAYGSSMSSNYNTRPLAAEVLVDGDSARLIRRRQTVEELLGLELGL